MAGNGTIGLEILEDSLHLPDVDAPTVVIAYAGGGLSCGVGSAIAYAGGGLSCGVGSAIRGARGDDVRLYSAEVENGAPFAASMAAGRPVVVDHTPTFVDGISGTMVFEEMWPLASKLMNGALVSTLKEVAHAVKLMVERNRVVSEGAGAASVAAAISGKGRPRQGRLYRLGREH